MDKARHALIVFDMQKDFGPGGALAVERGHEIFEPINAMMDNYGAVILTQDWHPADHASFADNHEGAAPFSLIDMPYGPQVLWPRHCVQGSEGADFHPKLHVDRADLILRKGFRTQIDSYSAFYENDHETPTGLSSYLNERGFARLSFVGLAHDFCVAWSAMDAAELGFEAHVIESATRAIDLDGSLEKARSDMREAGVVLE